MLYNNTKKLIKLIPVTALMLSIMFTGKVLADESSYQQTTASSTSTQQLQTLINWNKKVQATLSIKMENKLNLEMQALTNIHPEKSLYANQLPGHSDRDLVLIGTDKSGSRITARSTTPVVVIIDRKELCLLNL